MTVSALQSCERCYVCVLHFTPHPTSSSLSPSSLSKSTDCTDIAHLANLLILSANIAKIYTLFPLRVLLTNEIQPFTQGVRKLMHFSLGLTFRIIVRTLCSLTVFLEALFPGATARKNSGFFSEIC